MTGYESKEEGGDFILEAKNRKTKMWSLLRHYNTWLNVCRCVDNLEKVNNSTLLFK